MKRHSTIVSTLVLAAGLCAPASAVAGGPLLSGYGGPGAGSQAILGAALLGGGGAGGSSRGGAGGGSSITGSQGAGAGSRVNSSSTSGANGPGHRAGSPGATSAGGSATHPGAAGATPQIPSLRAGQATSAATPSWFTGADLLALVLAAGVLALVGLATVRLARTPHH